jgi:hypothetical protein
MTSTPSLVRLSDITIDYPQIFQKIIQKWQVQYISANDFDILHMQKVINIYIDEVLDISKYRYIIICIIEFKQRRNVITK